MALSTVVRSRANTNSTLVDSPQPPRRWILVNGKVRAIRAIRVRATHGGLVAVQVTRDWLERRLIRDSDVFDTAEAAAAALTPIAGFVVRVVGDRHEVNSEPIVLRGDGSYWPADRRGRWVGAATSRARARELARAAV